MSTTDQTKLADEPLGDVLITAEMLAERLRPMVLARFDAACLDGTPMIPLHRATVNSIYLHLERLAELDGETALRRPTPPPDVAKAAFDAGFHSGFHYGRDGQHGEHEALPEAWAVFASQDAISVDAIPTLNSEKRT